MVSPSPDCMWFDGLITDLVLVVPQVTLTPLLCSFWFRGDEVHF